MDDQRQRAATLIAILLVQRIPDVTASIGDVPCRMSFCAAKILLAFNLADCPGFSAAVADCFRNGSVFIFSIGFHFRSRVVQRDLDSNLSLDRLGQRSAFGNRAILGHTSKSAVHGRLRLK